MKLFDVLYTNKDYDGRALISSNNANACNFILQSQGKLGNSYQVTSILDVGESSFPEILISEYYSKKADNKQSTFNIKDVYNNMDFTKFSEDQIASLRNLLNIPEAPDYTDKFEEIQENIQDLSDADVDIKKKIDTNSNNINSIKTSVSTIQTNYGNRITTNENNIKKHTTSINTINDRLNNQDDSKEIFLTNKNFFNIGDEKYDDPPTFYSFSDIFSPTTHINGNWVNPFLQELNQYTNNNYSLEPAKVICRVSTFCTIENLKTFSIKNIYNNKNPFKITELDNQNEFHKMICRFAKNIDEGNCINHFFVLNIKFSNCRNGRFHKYKLLYDKDGYCIYHISKIASSNTVYIKGFNLDTIKEYYAFTNNAYEEFNNPKKKFIIQSNRYIWNVTDHIFTYNPYCYKNNYAIFIKKTGYSTKGDILNLLDEYVDGDGTIPIIKNRYISYKFCCPFFWSFANDKKFNFDRLSKVLSGDIDTIKQILGCNENYIKETSFSDAIYPINIDNLNKNLLYKSDTENNVDIYLTGHRTIYIGNYISPKNKRSHNIFLHPKHHIIGKPIIKIKFYGLVIDNNNTLTVNISNQNSFMKKL